MSTVGEFSSLLQLGVGLGIGLSVFRAPLELRASNLRRAIDDEWQIISGMATPKSITRQAQLATLRLRFSEATEKAEKYYRPFMIAALLGAALNTIFLIWASLQASRTLDLYWQILLIFISVVYFIVIEVVVYFIARRVFGETSGLLIQLRTAAKAP